MKFFTILAITSLIAIVSAGDKGQTPCQKCGNDLKNCRAVSLPSQLGEKQKLIDYCRLAPPATAAAATLLLATSLPRMARTAMSCAFGTARLCVGGLLRFF
jgi:hypothetical protein